MNVLERLSVVSKITELLESAKVAQPLERLSIMPNIFDLFSKLGVSFSADNEEEQKSVRTPDQVSNDNNALFEKYLAGGFNDESVEDFKQTMHKVNDLGLPFDSVKDGVISWFTANEDQIAA
ncbi:hypothetical protein I3271_05690 [Photobacterium leiognathi]|uniref:hypothetical protein n=1 Tax=Photobacterium leiognathi TaxID=553611 RepID=UPI001EE05A02|nr:hypothetical protein [Photobacterium leiognathi]MCG3884174.1 hypothetical protein [Photobacterium leiognathi]